MSSDEFVPPERPGPPGGKRDRNRRKRSADLERAALTLFLKRGVAAVSIDQLARAAKMAKGSFYRYAAGKAELIARLVDPLRRGVEEAFEHCASALGAAEPTNLPPIYMRLASELTALVRDNPDLVRLYLQESRAPTSPETDSITSLASHVRQQANHLTELGRERGLLAGVPTWLSAAVVVGATEELLLDHLSGAAERDPAAVQTALVSMVLHGIASWEPTSR